MKYGSREADKKHRSLEHAVQRTLESGTRGPRPVEPYRPHRHDDNRRERRHDHRRHEGGHDRYESDRSNRRHRREQDTSRSGIKKTASHTDAASRNRAPRAYTVSVPEVRPASSRTSPRASPRSSPHLGSQAPFVPPLDACLVHLLHAMAVTREAYEDRLTVLHDLRRTLRPLGLRVIPYGSVATGLLIPSSDVDCVMAIDEDTVLRRSDGSKTSIPPRLVTLLGALARANSMAPKERKSCFAGGMRLVANAMRSARVFTNILTIAHAKVPIVKCRHRDVGVKVDLSFEEDGCATSSFLINEFQKPGNELARPLIILVKAMIANWGLDDPSVGGLGSFPTSILVLFFLQTEVHKRYPAELQGSIGVLLCGFLKYYGFDFNFKASGIDYVQRCTIAKPATFELHVVNPVQPGHNCARAASLYPGRVIPGFQDAYNALQPLLGGDEVIGLRRVEAALCRFYATIVPTPDAWNHLTQSLARRSFAAQHRWTEEGIYTGGPI